MLSRIIICFVFLHTLTLAHQTIKYATVIYRHGDRTPVNCYPYDPYKNESLWPVGFGQLTNIGKEQHFKFGQYLRQRYSHLLSNKYDPKEIHIQSTDVDRTLMSAQANLAGMYPPIGKQIWDNNLLWQPIPVHTKPEHDDEVLAMKKFCDKYEIEKRKYTTSEKYLEKLSEYKNLMSYLSKHTGMDVTDFLDISDIYSCLNIEHLYNFTLPTWTKNVFPDKLREPAGYSFSISAGTPVMARLIIGPLVKEVTYKMQDVVHGKSKLKVSVYSGHDFTVGTLLTALGVFDNISPSYTATVFIELVQDEQLIFQHDYDVIDVENTHYVRLLYRNSVDIVEPKVLSIPNCGTLCPLSKFITLYSNLITVNWKKECNSPDHHYFVAVYLFCFAVFTIFISYKIVANDNVLRASILPWIPMTPSLEHDDQYASDIDTAIATDQCWKPFRCLTSGEYAESRSDIDDSVAAEEIEETVIQ